MFCTACAASVTPGLLRCTRCGAALAFATAAPLPRRTESAPSTPLRQPPLPVAIATKRRALRLLYLLPVALAVAAIVALSLRVYQREQEQERAYAQAQSALATGDYVDAVSLFRRAGDHRDAAAKHREVERLLAPYRDLYDRGAVALAAGDEAAAISSLLPVVRDMPAYRDASALLERARVDRQAHLLDDVEAALQAQDWPAAERLLQQLVALDPADPDLAARLRDVQHRHAPFVYARDRALLISSPGAAEPIVLNDLLPASWPVWSPDRTRIAFVSAPDTTSTASRTLFVVNADGTGMRELATGPAPWQPPVWSPDGTRIAFAVDGPTSEVPAAGQTVLIVDLTTGAVTDATGGTLANASSPAWSPSGDRLAFVVRPPDGPVYTTADNFQFALEETSDVYTLTLATGALAPIADGQVPAPWRIAWSPATEEILVYSRSEGTSFRRGYLYRLNAVTSALVPIDLASVDVSVPVWSPDGTRFAYIVRSDQVRVVGPGDVEMIIQSPVPLSRFLSWSPSGEAILAPGSAAGGESVVIDVGPGTSGQTEIIPLAYDGDSAFAAPPEWSPINPIPPPTAPTVGGTALDHPTDS